MLKSFLILSISCFFISNSFAQHRLLKRELKITKYDNYIDTLIMEYDKEGNLTNGSKYSVSINASDIIYRDSIVTIPSPKNILHQKEYWSDSTVFDIWRIRNKDTLLYLRIDDNDTIQIKHVSLQKRKKQLRYEHYDSYIYFYHIYKQFIHYKKSLPFVEKAMVISLEKNTMTSEQLDTVKIVFHKLFNKFEIYSFNEEMNEWFITRTFSRRKNKLVYEYTFFHEHTKEYSISKEVFVSDSTGNAKTIKRYDNNHLRSETTFIYEYY